MKKRILCAVVCLLLPLSSCSRSTVQETADLTSEDTGAKEVHMFECTEGLSFSDGFYSETEDGALRLSAGEYDVLSEMTFTLRFTSGYGSAEIMTDIKSEDGNVGSACKIRFFCGGANVSAYLVNGETDTLLARSPFEFEKGRDYPVRITGYLGGIGVYIYIDGMSSPCVDVKVKRRSSSRYALTLHGAGISEPAVSDTAALPDDAVVYMNPVIENTDIPDPTVFQYGGTYYLFGTGSFLCRTSEDLVHWKTARTIADKASLYGMTYYGGVSIYERGGRFYMLYTTYNPEIKGRTETCICYAVSDDILGPYTQPGGAPSSYRLTVNNSAGSQLFRDPSSGKDYLFFYRVDNGVGNVIYGAEASVVGGVITVGDPVRLVSPDREWERKTENGARGNVTERPFVYYHAGCYYLFYAGSHYKTSYGEGYAVSGEPLGEYVKYRNNPILSSTSERTGVGCVWLTESPSGALYGLYHSHGSLESIAPSVLCMDRVEFYPDPDGGPDIAFMTVTANRQAVR